MKKSSFENKVLEFMSDMTQFVKEQKEFNQKVDQRLSVLEKDVKQIKLLPTIKKELRNLE